ncbi:MAG: hypothetical protein AB7O62_11825 [Pirellulales bacterium]
MDRARRGVSVRFGKLVLALSMLLPFCGCLANAIGTMMYVIDPNDQKAEYNGLKGKRVVVVCRPPADLRFNYANVANELSRSVGIQLQGNVSKIKVVDPQEVAEWTDERTWKEYSEIGKALKADMVVGIDLDSFSLQQSQTVFQGHAAYRVQVIDLTDGSASVVYEKLPPQSVYPPNTGVPAQDIQEPQFRRRYIQVLGDEIGRLFYNSNPRNYFAGDHTAMN